MQSGGEGRKLLNLTAAQAPARIAPLRPDYPMVAERYAAVRRKLAKKIELGRKPGQDCEVRCESCSEERGSHAQEANCQQVEES